eukprot:3369803-Pyramimonas_sp.AAC.1
MVLAEGKCTRPSDAKTLVQDFSPPTAGVGDLSPPRQCGSVDAAADARLALRDRCAPIGSGSKKS